MDTPERLINLTPHPVTVLHDADVIAQWAASATPCRVVELAEPTGVLSTDRGPVPMWRVGYGDNVIEGLPDPVEGVAYVVSRVVAAATTRPDLYFPYPEVRDESRQIIGCCGFASFAHEEDR